MSTTETLKGMQAIRYAEAVGATLSKYEDPTEGEREGLTLEQAKEIAAVDASLIYVEADSDEVDVEIVSVEQDEQLDPDDAEEGSAWWVTARIGGKEYRLYACKAVDGSHRVEACGDSLDCWCDPDLRKAYGDRIACELGEEALALRPVVRAIFG